MIPPELVELVRRITNLEDRLDNLVMPEVGRWMNWTPTITQSGNVTFTNTFARYILQGSTVHLRARLTVTGTGTTANNIVIGGQPYAAANASGIIGTMVILDSGVGYYVGALFISGVTFLGRAHGLGSAFGVAPNFALANNDVIDIVGAYEIA